MTELQIDQELDDILEHHGVKGMKWGVKKAVAIGAQSRVNANNRTIARATKSANRKILPTKKSSAKRIEKLSASNARIAAGKPKVKDILDINSTIKIKDIRAAILDQDL